MSISPSTLVHLVRAREFLSEHYAASLSLSDLAREAGYSPFHLHRSFTEAFGETPLEFMKRMRLAEALRLLLRSQMSVAEACIEVGYQSPSTFTRMFTREFGVAPTEYRRSILVPDFGPLRLIPSCFLFRSVA